MTTEVRMKPTKHLLGLALVAAAAVLVWLLWWQAPTAPEGNPSTQASAQKPIAPAGAESIGERQPAPPPNGAANPEPGVASQGLRGRIVDAAGRPVAFAAIYAVRASTRDPFELAELAMRGITEPPSAETKSGTDGGFALPIGSEGIGTAWLVYALHPQFADGSKQSRKLVAATWTDLGTIVLEQGLEVTGTVIADATGSPIANATVTLRPAARTYTLSPLPTRERGLTAITNGVGAYRFVHVPQGSVAVRAEAAGFACAELAQVQLQTTEANEFHLSLLPGGEIGGTVTDRTGRALANAWILAEAIDLPNQPSVSARSGADGRFSLSFLGTGNYQLRAAAPDYQQTLLEPVALHRTDVQLVLKPQAALRLKVLGSDGAVVTDYELQLRRADAASGDRIAAPQRRMLITKSQLDQGRARVHGLDPGEWQLSATAAGHAESDTLQVALDDSGAEPEVDLRLRVGGTIAGSVVDGRGSPIAGAIVALEPAASGGTVAVFRSLLASPRSPVASTDTSGQFACQHVAPGAYVLRIRHPSFAPVARRDITVTEGQLRRVDAVTLPAGTELSGTALLDGQPLAKGRVQLLALDANDTPNGFVAEARSGDNGQWRMPNKLGAGRYVLLLNRSLPDNPFQESADQQASRMEITIGAAPAQAIELNLHSSAPPTRSDSQGK
jgi:protocatechuate 3,4-dioxygenase beta subunit